MSQRKSFAEETRSPLEQPLIREDTAPENAKGEGEGRVMEESVLGSLPQPAPYSLRSSAFQETIEEKACSDPSLQEPKDHSFMFKSVGEGPHSGYVLYVRVEVCHLRGDSTAHGCVVWYAVCVLKRQAVLIRGTL